MQQVNIYEAKTNLSKLVDRVEHGEEIIIARAGKPAARLTQVEQSSSRRRLGVLDGKFTIPDDFNRSLPKEVLQAFEEGE